ncbi:MAG: hypothetical protein ACOX8V_05655 [Thermoleophilia bacterium]|jgi:hypothetical protein
MAEHSLQKTRLAFKRAFISYYVELRSPGVVDPTHVFSRGYVYLAALLDQYGPHEFMRRLDDETTHLAGQLEQDLRRRSREGPMLGGYDDLEDRLWECVEYARGRLEEQGYLEEGRDSPQ